LSRRTTRRDPFPFSSGLICGGDDMNEKPSGPGLVGMIALPLALVACCAFGPAILAALAAGSWGSLSGLGPWATAAIAIGAGGAVYFLARKRRRPHGACAVTPSPADESARRETGVRTAPSE